MKIYQIYGTAPYYANNYIVSDEKGGCVLIEASASVNKIKEVLNNEKAELKAVLITHGHFDHVDTIKELQQAFEDVKFYLDSDDAATFEIENTTKYPSNNLLDIGDMKFNIIHTPGHTRGGVCLSIENSLFTGDTLFAGTVGRTDLEGGNYDVLINSLKTILDNVADNTAVLPGHNHTSTIAKEKVQNPYLKGVI